VILSSENFMDLKKEIKASFDEIKKSDDIFDSLEESLLINLLDSYTKNKAKDDKAIIAILSSIIEGQV